MADLSDVNLITAELMEAHFEHTTLAESDLGGANLSGAVFIMTIMGRSSLSHTIMPNGEKSPTVILTGADAMWG